MDYALLLATYHALEKTTKRLAKTTILAQLFKNTTPTLLKSVVYLAQGRVYPGWSEEKIGFSDQLMIKALASVYGTTPETINKHFSKLGDLGKVAEQLAKKKSQQTLFHKKLDVEKVYYNIRQLSRLEGEGTVKKKIQLVSELFSNATPEEARFITGTILENLRLGVADGIIRDAIAEAYGLTSEEIEQANDLLVDYGEIASLAAQQKLREVHLVPGRPLHVMLAILVKDINEGFERVGKPAALEYKYDGFRVLCHKEGKKISLYTRRMEEVTNQFPDVVEALQECINAESYIIDSEVVGYDPKTKKYQPFQSISQRIKRKYDIRAVAKDFPIEINVFDILYYNNKSFLEEPFQERRKLLEKVTQEKKEHLRLAQQLITEDKKKAEQFYQAALQAGHEGIMFKSLSSKYKPGRYIGYMAKLKPVLETLDLVITRADWGEGKRSRWLSSFTVACRDESDNLVELGKVSTGLKEKKEEGITFEQLTEELKPHIISEEGTSVAVKPTLVIEVAFEEIQRSPTYESGYALRFPRIIRVRFDRSINDISTIDEAIKIFSLQRGRTKKPQ
ncbi:MAG TPA: ATP-dependent DNA ligase [Candidatus Nanoarchaeia archaeon]|nr:ATP-dependent DNA ligase [Candidatus Nanoarchaeia archaeon]